MTPGSVTESAALLSVVVPAVFVVLGGQAPGSMLVVRFGAAFRARLHRDLIRTLEGAGFLEAPIPSLFHVVLPVSETCVNAGSVSLPTTLGRR